MTKEQLVQLIEAYADAKASKNNYLVSMVAQNLTEVINNLFQEEKQGSEE